MPFFIFFSLIASPCSAAGPSLLFSEPGVEADGYNGIVWQLKRGDQIQFSNGKVFKIKKPLDKGTSTWVLETSKGTALRIPLRSGVHGGPLGAGDIRYTDFIDEYIGGSRSLSQLGISVPRVYDSLQSEYVEVEKITKKFSLEDFIHGGVQLSSAERELAERRLLDWAKQLWPLAELTDFNDSQVVYDGKRWILLDMTSGYERASGSSHETVFSYGPDEIHAELRKVVLAERARHLGQGSSFERCIAAGLSGLR